MPLPKGQAPRDKGQGGKGRGVSRTAPLSAALPGPAPRSDNSPNWGGSSVDDSYSPPCVAVFRLFPSLYGHV